jgi:hypothetical protein
LGAGAVALVAFYLRAVLPYELNPYDEGVIAYGAEQVLKGRRPGVDFYVPYSPGAFYAVAAAFRLFGVRLLVERGVGAALVLTAVALGFALLVRRSGDAPLSPPRILLAAIAAAAAGVLLSIGWFSPVTGGALALLLLSGLAVTHAALAGTPRAGFLAGLTVGLLMLWRLDFGLGGLAAAGVTWVVCGVGSRIAGLLALGLGAAVIAVPPFAGLLAAGGKRAMNSLLVWPLSGTQAADLPWPPLVPGPLPSAVTTLERLAHATGGWPFYFPLLAVLLALLRMTRRETLTPREISVGTWLLAAAIPMFLYANGRTDYAHVLPLLTLSLLLAALAVMGMLDEATLPARPAARVAPVVARWSFILALLLFVWSPLAKLARIPPAEVLRHMELPGERGAGIYPDLPVGMQYERILRAFNQVVPPGGRIFSGTPRHDVFLTNDIMLYFLAEREPATYYWCLDAGVTTTPAVQQEMIRDLERAGTGAVAIWLLPRNDEANESARSSGVTLFDDYLKRAYRPAPYQSPNAPVRFYDLLLPAGSTE